MMDVNFQKSSFNRVEKKSRTNKPTQNRCDKGLLMILVTTSRTTTITTIKITIIIIKDDKENVPF